MKKLILLILVSIFFATPSLASNDGFSTIDYGSCADFVNNYEYCKNNLLGKGVGGEDIQRYADHYKLAGYIDGFVTGTNKEKARVVSSGSAGWQMFIYNYCKKNPLDLLMHALIELDEELDK